MSKPVVLGTTPLGLHWETRDPFLFCAHHDDAYPPGNEEMGPAASLAGRNIGMDFEGIDGWRMYHGDVVPGFPRHPHRGFETVTLARSGYIDHSDSLGATARFGHGDVQWMTAGSGIVHAEMFPLVERERSNPTELFQVWLNLPRADKLVPPHFAMLWNHTIPKHTFRDGDDRATDFAVVAGQLGDRPPPAPPPSSWAARPDSHVAIWTIRMDPGARWTVPATEPGINRTLYFFRGASMRLAERELEQHAGVRVRPDAAVELVAGPDETELLLLQGRPIGEPVAQYGPFVMNTPLEIQQAFVDFRRTEFGGWPWPSDGPVHARDEKRFAIHADGRRESAE
jgi:hypothetical protein